VNRLTHTDLDAEFSSIRERVAAKRSPRVKPIASLSLDLDNEWAYLKTRGDASWETFPSYLDLVVPRFLTLLERLGQRITVFIVGQDAALERNAAALRAIAAAGHEIGNHSFHHEPWLHTYSRAKIEDEISRSTEAIVAATGARPRGFRGPGYSLSLDTLETLVAQGFHYDCSTFPTYLGPLARQYYFWTAKISADERKRRAALFGSLSDGLRPLRSYRWELGNGSLIEIPVTTFPLLKLPIHFSYILFLAQLAPPLAQPYFGAALAACRLGGIGPSLLLHPLDFLDATDVPSLAFFPAMRMPHGRKLTALERALRAYRGAFDVGPVGEHAAAVAAAGNVRPVVPRFAI
jgi:peptidoglycan/xylan/chitin deacetylase (PgdA/CDA1 family)